MRTPVHLPVVCLPTAEKPTRTPVSLPVVPPAPGRWPIPAPPGPAPGRDFGRAPQRPMNPTRRGT